MAKRFFDVFPSLKVEGDMKNLLTETEVTKVGMLSLIHISEPTRRS